MIMNRHFPLKIKNYQATSATKRKEQENRFFLQEVSKPLRFLRAKNSKITLQYLQIKYNLESTISSHWRVHRVVNPALLYQSTAGFITEGLSRITAAHCSRHKDAHSRRLPYLLRHNLCQCRTNCNLHHGWVCTNYKVRRGYSRNYISCITAFKSERVLRLVSSRNVCYSVLAKVLAVLKSLWACGKVKSLVYPFCFLSMPGI